jgi:hypothetical protein
VRTSEVARRVIMPSYQFHVENNLLGTNPNPETFFAARILWDESIASSAARYVVQRKATTGAPCTIVCLCGADHVKFSKVSFI